jgi:rare lipoprotein A
MLKSWWKPLFKFLFVLLFAFSMALPSNAATVGWASYYKMGRFTANGERFKPMGYTAAHRHLAFGTKLKVTNLRNGKFVIVRINDRGPFIKGRVLDLSWGAAKAIGLTGTGVGKISFIVMK